MRYRKLGKTDIKVSTVAFGAWAIAGGFTWGAQDEEDSIAALRAAYDSGVTLFDTAEGYGSGKSEELIGRALHDVRDKIVIATKVSPKHFAPDLLRRSCGRSLKALLTDRIDLYQLHWPNRDIPIEHTLDTLEQLKENGMIRAYGVSNFGKKDLTKCISGNTEITSNQMSYSLLFRAVEHEVLPLCGRNRISVLCYSPLMQGLLTGKFLNAHEVPEDRARTRLFSDSRPHVRHGEQGAEQLTFEIVAQIKKIADELGEPMADVSIAWLLAQPGVTSVIAGARNAGQSERNARAADLVLTEDVMRQLTLITDPLKDRMGTNMDMWKSNSRIE